MINKFFKSIVNSDEIFKGIPENDISFAKNYLENSIADAEFTYLRIKNYLSDKKNILEVGGGLHILSFFLISKGFKVTSLEPGEFNPIISRLRTNFLKKIDQDFVFTCYLEDFITNEEFDFIFSINVLEHTGDIYNHIEKMKKLKNVNGEVVIRCPNYNIPFDSHFYSFFIPRFPNFTFKKLLKNRLIKKYGKEYYENMVNNINFSCKYSNISKNYDFEISNPFLEIFYRLENDSVFRRRLLKNKLLNIIYKLNKIINLTKIFKLIPKKFYPYLIIKFNF